MELTKILLDWTASIAWPLVLLLIVLVYRSHLDRLLSSLGGIAERVHKEPVDITIGEKFKIRFGESIKNLEERARDLMPRGTRGVDMPITRGDEFLPGPGVDVSPPPGESLQDAQLLNLYHLAEILPRAAILEAWREVELAFEKVATHYEGLRLPASTERGRWSRLSGEPVSPAVLARLLFEQKFVDEATLSVFEELRQLRNHVSYATELQPSAQDAKEYVRVAIALAARIHMSSSWEGPPNIGMQPTAGGRPGAT